MAASLTSRIVRFFSSLGLTVTLLALSTVLVFVATLDQVELGIYAVQEKWFRSWVVVHFVGKIGFLYPGGYTLGFLLLFNLLAGHATRFKLSWKKSGIFLTHFGLIMLLLGEFFTGILQEDFQMRMAEGESKNYSESFRLHELAVIDASDAQLDRVTAIPAELLAQQPSIQHPTLPFRVEVRAYYPHAGIQPREKNGAGPSLATTGMGSAMVVTPAAPPKGDDPRYPAAFVELFGAEGSLGTYLVSALMPQPETLQHAGKTWRLALRIQREYKPFSLQLLKVTHEVYPGSDIPKNFASQVQLHTADGKEKQEFKIYMNNPLRFGGYTFYQYQMNAADSTTVLQVVKNPSWLVPYIACIIMALGLIVQFSISLWAFADRRRRLSAPASGPATRASTP